MMVEFGMKVTLTVDGHSGARDVEDMVLGALRDLADEAGPSILSNGPAGSLVHDSIKVRVDTVKPARTD